MWKLRQRILSYNIFYPGIITLVITFFGFLFGIIPGIQSIMDTWTAVSDLHPEVASLKKRYAVLTGVDELSLRSDLEKLYAATPVEPAIGSAFVGIETLARESGVSLTDISLTGPGNISTDSAGPTRVEDETTGSFSLPIKVGFQGTVDQIGLFFAKVVAVRRLYRVSHASVQFNTLNNQSTTSASLVTPALAEGTVTIDAFYTPERKLPLARRGETLLSDSEQVTLTSVINLPLVSPIFTGEPSGNTRFFKPNPFIR